MKHELPHPPLQLYFCSQKHFSFRSSPESHLARVEWVEASLAQALAGLRIIKRGASAGRDAPSSRAADGRQCDLQCDRQADQSARHQPSSCHLPDPLDRATCWHRGKACRWRNWSRRWNTVIIRYVEYIACVERNTWDICFGDLWV